MNVLVTGHKGYIGVHLVELLKSRGHRVVGCDLGIFDGCQWETCVQPDYDLAMDVRNLEAADLTGLDCVMHLAAISNDAMGEIDLDLTYSINRDASHRLAEVAKKAAVPRFLFSSSCSVYGRGQELDLAEYAPLNPLTAYAKSKIEAEALISKLADSTLSPVYLRNATAYGHSPMLRIDLVANNLLSCAFATGEITIMSDGTPWRPLIHCRDIARAFIALMHSERELIHNQVVNVGANHQNFQVKDVVQETRRLLPEARVAYTGEAVDDPRSYRVNFDRLAKLIPDFQLQYNLASGMKELHAKFVEHSFSKTDYQGDQFVRLRMLKKRVDRISVSA